MTIPTLHFKVFTFIFILYLSPNIFLWIINPHVSKDLIRYSSHHNYLLRFTIPHLYNRMTWSRAWNIWFHLNSLKHKASKCCFNLIWLSIILFRLFLPDFVLLRIQIVFNLLILYKQLLRWRVIINRVLTFKHI
jgi:hypothetical protein